MKKRYLVVALLLMLLGISSIKALSVGDCKVLVSFKLNSSLDEEKYICKGISYGKSTDYIYYPGEGTTIYLNNLNAYYFTNWSGYDVEIDISGKNNISLLHIVSNSNFKVIGDGSLKFKQNSFVKKIVNGESVYQFIYDGKLVLSSDKKIYEGTILEFEDNYETLKDDNDLPDEYNIDDYELMQVADYTKMTSVVVTESWIDDNVNTTLNKSISDGYGIIEYIEAKDDTAKTDSNDKTDSSNSENSQLETDNIILISDTKLKSKYTLQEENLKEQEIGEKISDAVTDKDLVSFYDVTVYNGTKEVTMKDGNYIIKIKIDGDILAYEDYQIIYVNDDGEIEEYIDGYIEGEYIVFETTHLSQYGVIASPVEEETVVVSENDSNNKIINILKVSFLAFLGIAFLLLIVFIVLKSNLLKTKKKRKKKKRNLSFRILKRA